MRRASGCGGCLTVLLLLVALYAVVTGKPWAGEAMSAAALLAVMVVIVRAAGRFALRLKAKVMLADAHLGELPPLLRAPVPRPGPFLGGYLEQGTYRAWVIPLLHRGVAVRAVVVDYHESRDNEGPDVDFAYAWLDDAGNLELHELHDSYDEVHAALSRGKGSMIVSLDAAIALGKTITVVHDPLDTKKHVIYEALLLDS